MPFENNENGLNKLSVSEYSKHNRSDEINEIISLQPSFIAKWALLLFSIIIILIMGAAWFIQYPDIVATKAKLTSINAPKIVVCKIEGKLIKLDVKEGDFVKDSNIIGYMETTANPKKIIQLSNYLDTLSFFILQNKIEIFKNYFPDNFNNLGELQQSYQTFLQAFLNFKNYLSNGFYQKKKSILESDMNYLKELQKIIIQQKIIQQQDIALAQKTFDENDSLKKQKVYSQLEYRNEKSKLLNKQLSSRQTNASLITNKNQQNEKQKEILELENAIGQQRSIFEQALNTFKSAIDDWKRKFLLIAPISGNVFFANFLQENQQLKRGETICYINPGNSSYYAEMLVPQSNLGKVKTGQNVLLKFPAYPEAEYGSVIGKIEFISNIPSDNGYLAKISLPKGLTTNYNKQIFFRNGLIADASIITKNMRLLKRFYYNIYKQTKR